jgi:hypothetical protein
VSRSTQSNNWNISVMAGLVPAIHVFKLAEKQDVNARHKAGHDA